MGETRVKDGDEVMRMLKQADLLQQLIEGFLPFTGLSKHHLLVFYHLQQEDMMLEQRGGPDTGEAMLGERRMSLEVL